MWFVPLSSVLAAHGLAHIRPYAFATSGVAAFVSPLLFGAVADRHASPVKVLRWLAIATAIAIWERTNLANLEDNILPTRPRATLILKKGADHEVETVALRRL